MQRDPINTQEDPILFCVLLFCRSTSYLDQRRSSNVQLKTKEENEREINPHRLRERWRVSVIEIEIIGFGLKFATLSRIDGGRFFKISLLVEFSKG